MFQPPSALLRDFFFECRSNPSDASLKNITKKCLLPENEVRMWLDHFQTVDTNRKRGAAKAAETRQRKQQEKQTTTGEAEENVAHYRGVYV